jgi:hypothetical protein
MRTFVASSTPLASNKYLVPTRGNPRAAQAWRYVMEI